MSTHYLIDHEYLVDKKTLFASMGHLLVFNPGQDDANLQITIYFEDREPETFPFIAPARKSTETNYARWPVQPNARFALEVESDRPVVCQSTNGWNNTGNDYSPGRPTVKSSRGVRECAKSYMAITQLNQDWYLPDGIIIDMPERMWVRESEWAILLNPGDQPAQVNLALHYDEVVEHKTEVAARRLKYLYMDDIARRNEHYGVHFTSNVPIAVQWLRVVKWHDQVEDAERGSKADRAELMTYWSVPCVPGPLV